LSFSPASNQEDAHQEQERGYRDASVKHHLGEKIPHLLVGLEIVAVAHVFLLGPSANFVSVYIALVTLKIKASVAVTGRQ
jgi:hypothetical protein